MTDKERSLENCDDASALNDEGVPLKKSETIEIRLPHKDKQAFVLACKAEGKTVSAVLRGAINLHLQHGHFVFPQSSNANRRADMKGSLKMILTGFFAGGLTVAAAFTVFDEAERDYGPFVSAYFAKIDQDGNGEISLPEYIGNVGKASSASQILPQASVGNYYLHNAEFKTNNMPLLESDAVIMSSEKAFTVQSFDTVCQSAINDIAIAQHTYEHALLDLDNNQALSMEEFSQSQLLPDILRITAEHNLFDIDGNGDVSFEEFNSAFSGNAEVFFVENYSFQQTVKLPPECHKALGEGARLSLWNSYDLNYGARRQKKHIEELFDSIDLNDDKRIVLQEFINRILSKI
ncbi:EF-hand domain-containing protein [Kordiimonas aquimaris]|uniref:EF-hand domain-containing protein n=1 Tax=Kordiimonas aquimaris TaxID=707591 RepID=UPI0021CE1921|nr:EF-hand domain-containing protein [Kordiimonas aquimaris]